MANNVLGQPMDGGSLQNLPPNATNEQQTAVLNDVINRLNSLLRTQIFADSTNKRMLIGYQKDGWGVGQDFGIKVSIEGVDVNVATDEELLFKMGLEKWTWRDNEGTLVKDFDIAGGVETFYDPADGTDIGKQGILPNGLGGSAWAKDGESVTDAFNS